VILYHCVTGRVPFAGTSLAQVLGQIMLAPPIPLREITADVPEAFEEVVLRAMAKDPAARYQDALAFGRALLPFASQRARVSYAGALGIDVGDTLIALEPPTGSRAAPAAGSGGTLSGMAHSVAKARSARTVPPWAAAVLVIVAILVTYRLVTTSRRQSLAQPEPLPVAPPNSAANAVPVPAPPSATAATSAVTPGAAAPSLEPTRSPAENHVVPPVPIPKPEPTPAQHVRGQVAEAKSSREARPRGAHKPLPSEPSQSHAPAPTAPSNDDVWGDRH
jgi:hypothetical protein